jgi:hypothetical protein
MNSYVYAILHDNRCAYANIYAQRNAVYVWCLNTIYMYVYIRVCIYISVYYASP